MNKKKWLAVVCVGALMTLPACWKKKRCTPEPECVENAAGCCHEEHLRVERVVVERVSGPFPAEIPWTDAEKK